jgi:hypothetical protein
MVGSAQDRIAGRDRNAGRMVVMLTIKWVGPARHFASSSYFLDCDEFWGRVDAC